MTLNSHLRIHPERSFYGSPIFLFPSELLADNSSSLDFFRFNTLKIIISIRIIYTFFLLLFSWQSSSTIFYLLPPLYLQILVQRFQSFFSRISSSLFSSFAPFSTPFTHAYSRAFYYNSSSHIFIAA